MINIIGRLSREVGRHITQIGSQIPKNEKLFSRIVDKRDFSQIQPAEIDKMMLQHQAIALSASRIDQKESSHTLFQETIERLKDHVSKEFKHSHFFQYGLKLEEEAVDYIYRELCHIIYQDHTRLFVGQPIKLISSVSKIIQKSLARMSTEVRDIRSEFSFAEFQKHLEETLKEFKMKSMFSFEHEFAVATDVASLFSQPRESRHFSAHPVYNGQILAA